MTKLAIWLGLLFGCCWLALACGNTAQGGDTQTNWLKTCTSDAECGELECVCGRCTRSCSAASDCSGTPLATSCQAADSQAALSLCGATEPVAMCLSACESVSSCGSGEQCSGGACVPGGAATGDANEFCQRYIDEYAQYMERCACGAVAAERFRQENQPICAPGGSFDSWAQAVARGDLIFDPAAADALFARFDEPDPLCVEEPFRALKLDSLEVYSWAGVFTGTRELGSPCTMPVSFKGGVSDCREGLCAGPEPGSGVCVALVGEGEECNGSGSSNLNGDYARLCFERRQPDADGEYESAFDSMGCQFGAIGTPGICMRDLQVQSACHSDEACASGYCNLVGANLGGCADKLPDGESCTGSNQCLSGSCDYSAVPAVCGAPLADGQACNYDHAACASGNCIDLDGSGGACGPAPTQAVGEACSAAPECISPGHGGSADGLCQGGICVADVCASYLD